MHQMSDFKAKMHQIRFPLGLCPRPRLRSLQRSLRALAVFEGSTSKRRERGEGRKGKERKRKVKGTEGKTRWREGFSSPKSFGVAPLCQTLAGFKGGRGA